MTTVPLSIVLFVVALGAVLLIILWYWDRLTPLEVRNHFPLFSDEEFVRRCGPGTDPAVALKVRAIIAEVAGIPAEEIAPEHRLGDDLGLD